MAVPPRFALELYAGDDLDEPVTFLEGGENTDPEDCTPIDVSGSTWLAQIRNPPGAGSVLLEITVDDTDAAAGTIRLQIDHDDVTLDLDGASWDLQETDADGRIATALAGQVTVTQDVSRP